jgi:uncharacterized protein
MSGPAPIQPPPPGAPPGKDTEKEARTMAMLAHLLGALFSFLGPLIIWLIKKDEHPFINDQGKEALNFQLFLLIGYLLSGILWVVISLVTCGIGALLPLPLIITVLQLVFGIIGAVKANQGEYYRYPLTYRFIQ